ncbi:zinc finger protein 714-like [Penaeus monodon]|uniref:zinc finger protein 714-like n=1 Tax=Penaeus monodon TaxID=6687 RepID=UPI0018A78262|nr:zinc finger protein 714-like [Penaeus monodon]
MKAEGVKNMYFSKFDFCGKFTDCLTIFCFGAGSVDVTRKFIKIRGEKHAEISQKGHNAVYQEILEKLGISDKVSVMMARKKWNYLVKRYQDEEMAGGERTWAFMKEMGQVMKHFRGANVNKLKSRASPEFLWPNELTRRFIELRVSRHSDFLETGIQNTYTEIMEELGLEHILNPNQLRKKWNYLVAKYKELSCTTGPDGTSPAPHSWPFYDDMHQALQQIPESALHSNRTVRTNFENIWTKEVTTRFIQLRGARPPDNTKKVSSVFANIVDELGLTGVITPNQARKKWNYLWSKYVDLSHPDVSEYTRQSWPFYTTMQAVVGALPLSQVLTKKGLVDELEEDEDPQKKIVKRTRQYTCFVCGKTGKILNDFFMYEHDQRLLYTQKTVLEVISHLVSRKMVNMESSTCLCSGCTNLVNEADSVIQRHDRIKEMVQGLYYSGIAQAKLEPMDDGFESIECDVDFDDDSEDEHLITHKKEVHTVIDNTPLEVEETILENGVITYFNKGKANNSETSHPCRECDKHFLRKDDLWYHQEIAHTEGKGRAKTAFKDRTYACEECGETFLFKYKLKMHINSKHLNDAGQNANDFTCGECGCKLGSLPGLTFHMRKHHNKSLTYRKTTEYLCSDCGFMAPSNKKLREHQEAHCGSSTKPKVQCEICGKTSLKCPLKCTKLRCTLSLKNSVIGVENDMPPKLIYCGISMLCTFAFSFINCQYCGERFATSDALRYHRV